jgi:hypothetical protein
MRITELIPGNEIHGWMQLGRALKRGRHFDGSVFRYVPLKSAVAGPDDLQRFTGTVVQNDKTLLILTLNVAKMGRFGEMAEAESLKVDIAYPLLQRIRILSPINYPADNTPDPKWPTKDIIYKPYRTITEVTLKW